jgi:hypothetical protein
MPLGTNMAAVPVQSIGPESDLRTSAMKKLLVAYDYGTGGLWAYVIAPSLESVWDRIHSVRPHDASDFSVLAKPPPFWNAQLEAVVTTYASIAELESRWSPLRDDSRRDS